jgi:CheY-like chemotaxis protein
MAKRRILVVEDEGITALHLQSILEEEGYEITSTANGRRGIRVRRGNSARIGPTRHKISG